MGGLVSGIGDALGGAVKAVSPYAGLIGGALGGPMGAAAGSILGGALGGSGQQVQSGLSGYGGYLQNQSNVAANQQAARAAQFRPVGITNTFGTSNFGYDANGNLTSAGYTLDPRLQSAQNTLMGNLGSNLQDTANIQAMGRQYMATSPQEQAAQYMANQQALLAPSREQQSANLMNQLSNTGRTGLSVAQGGNLGMSNPEYQALANARAQQDLQLAANATQAGQQQYQFGQGLLSSAYQPYTAGLTAVGATEGLGQQPLELSASLAGRSATAGNNAAGYLKTAASQNPMASFLTSAGTNAQLGQGIAGLFGSGGWAGSPGGLDTSNIDYSYLSNIYSKGNPFAGTSWDGE
jgi:YD repeat-containing protein